MAPSRLMVRTGRRPGESGSREAILAAAREHFAEAGYDGASLRGIARSAGVDPSLVSHFFGSKRGVFAAAVALPVDPGAVLPGVLAGEPSRLGERLVRFFLGLWEDPATRTPFLALLRTTVRQDEAARLLSQFIGREVISRLAPVAAGPDAELRATLVGSQLIGLAVVRYVVRVEPLASADVDTVVAAVAPTVQGYLTRSAPAGPPAG